MKAGLWVFFLLVSVSGFVQIPIGDTQIQTEVDSSQDGAGFNLPSFAAYIDIPRSNFLAQTWCFIDSMSVDDAPLMSLKTGPSTTFDVSLVGLQVTGSHAGVDHNGLAEAQNGNRWVYLVMGSLKGTSFVTVGYRDSDMGFKFYEWSEKIFVHPDSWFKGPVGAGHFKVCLTQGAYLNTYVVLDAGYYPPVNILHTNYGPVRSFLCSARLECPACHDSCSSCTAGKCNGCKDATNAQLTARGWACMCPSGQGFKDGNLQGTCEDCHANCERCVASDDSSSCLTCTAPNSGKVLLYEMGNDCGCAPGYTSGFDGCISCDENDCMSRDEEEFIGYVNSYNVRLPTETNHLFCYRMPTVGSDCLLTGLYTAAVTAIPNIDGAMNPSFDQCNLILHTQWPVLTSWFAELFPTLLQYTDNRRYYVPILWILEFGPNKLRTDPQWQSFLADINALGAFDWKNFLAWGGDTPQYTSDGGTTFKDLPEDLRTRIYNPAEFALLNSGTELCREGTALMSQCILAGLD